MRRYFALLLLALVCFGFQKKSKAPKPPDVLAIDVTCRRVEGEVQVDGKFKVAAEKPIRKLQLIIDFFGADKQLLQTKRTQVDDGTLDPGEETEFQTRVPDPVRAVYWALRATDGDGRELRLDKEALAPIE